MGTALMDGWALWMVGGIAIGLLLLACDEWRLRKRGQHRQHR